MIESPKSLTEQLQNLVEGMAIEMRKLRNSFKRYDEALEQIAGMKTLIVEPDPEEELERQMNQRE